MTYIIFSIDPFYIILLYSHPHTLFKHDRNRTDTVSFKEHIPCLSKCNFSVPGCHLILGCANACCVSSNRKLFWLRLVGSPRSQLLEPLSPNPTCFWGTRPFLGWMYLEWKQLAHCWAISLRFCCTKFRAFLARLCWIVYIFPFSLQLVASAGTHQTSLVWGPEDIWVNFIYSFNSFQNFSPSPLFEPSTKTGSIGMCIILARTISEQHSPYPALQDNCLSLFCEVFVLQQKAQSSSLLST